MDEVWSEIKPVVWTMEGKRLYLYLSPSGITHLVRLGEIWSGRQYHDDYILETLCGRKGQESSKDYKRTGWRRVNTLDIGLGYDLDPFMEITCKLCAKNAPEFKDPIFEIEMAPYGSDRDNPELFMTYAIPAILDDRRCDTCNYLCDPWVFKRRQKNVREKTFDGKQRCSLWCSNAYYRRQRALILTNEQIRSLPYDRLQLIYDKMMHGGLVTATKASFITRLVTIMREKEDLIN